MATHPVYTHCEGCGKAIGLPLPANPGWKYCRDCLPLEDTDYEVNDPENALRTHADVQSQQLGLEGEE